MIALAALVIIQAPFLAYWGLRSAGVVGSATGMLAIETDPAGLDVIVDGRASGRTPVELTLAEGTRSVVLKQGDALAHRRRERAARRDRAPPLRVRRRRRAAAAAASSGTLQVTSEPRACRWSSTASRAASRRSRCPICRSAPTRSPYASPPPRSSSASRSRKAPPSRCTWSHRPRPGRSPGWLSVDVASPLQIFEEGRLVGTTNIGRLLLPPGVHVLDFVSDELGFRAQRTVTVRPGAATDVRLELPAVTLSVNAQPWAEVFVDGERVGETPIGTLSRPVGRHEILLRHPGVR